MMTRGSEQAYVASSEARLIIFIANIHDLSVPRLNTCFSEHCTRESEARPLVYREVSEGHTADIDLFALVL